MYFHDQVRFTGQWEEWSQMLLFDPQTSGGLLLSVAEERLRGFLEKAAQIDLPVS